MKPVCSIIVPTWNNPEYLDPCIDSIRATNVLNGLCELVIINNGSQPIKEKVKDWPNTRVLEPGKNLGWENGLQYGIDHTDTEYLCFQNDDTLIPKATQSFYEQLLWPFQNKNVGAVGPATTVASGWHSIYMKHPLRVMVEVPYLIFFTVMIRRDDLIAAGGIDTSCPGGDDLDLSIRLRKMGKSLLINPDAFLIHHAFKTGTRVRGDQNTPNGWNSREMIDRTNRWLINKHGFKTFTETMRGFDYAPIAEPKDVEGEMVAGFVQGENIVELGCGFRKTVPNAVGVDIVEKGKPCNHLNGPPSVADITADITKPLPLNPSSVDTIIARHILEHVTDMVGTVKQWSEVLKEGGRMIIAVPDQTLRNTIPMNPEHVHGFTPEALKSLMGVCGFKTLETQPSGNRISFVGVFEKLPVVVEKGELVHA